MAESSSTPVESLRARVASAADELQKALITATPEERSAILQQVDAMTRQAETAKAVKTAPAESTAPAGAPTTDAPVSGDVPDSNIEPVSATDVEAGKGTEAFKYTAETQPRDATGKFRKVLALLKENLGESGNQGVLDQLKETEELGNVGNYSAASKAATQLVGTIDRLDSGALNAKSLENVRLATGELGKVIANLPLPFEEQSQKLRFSDLPPALKSLAEDMIKKVEAKIGQKEADVATAELRGFMSGSDVYSQAEISSQMNRLLRLLT